MTKDDVIKLANSKIDHEHFRWATWTVFFFGAIVSIFTMWGAFKDDLPDCLPFFVSGILSILWVFAALGLRRNSAAWVNVIIEINKPSENQNDYNPNELFKKHENQQDFAADFYDMFAQKNSWFRVTRLLTILGTLLSGLFLVLGGYFCHKSDRIHKSEMNIEIKGISRNIETIIHNEKRIGVVEKRISHLDSLLSLTKKKP